MQSALYRGAPRLGWAGHPAARLAAGLQGMGVNGLTIGWAVWAHGRIRVCKVFITVQAARLPEDSMRYRYRTSALSSVSHLYISISPSLSLSLSVVAHHRTGQAYIITETCLGALFRKPGKSKPLCVSLFRALSLAQTSRFASVYCLLFPKKVFLSLSLVFLSRSLCLSLALSRAQSSRLTAVHSTATVHMYAWQIADALASGDAHIDQPRSRAGEAALSHHSTRAARTHVVKPLMRAH